jgi:DNA polymerase III alpha subunit (gram-positive type)
MLGGSELVKQGLRGIERDHIIRFEMSALTPEHGEIIHFYAINRWDEDDEFDEWARPSVPLSDEAERIVGTTNEKLAHCRPTMIVMDDFLAFLGIEYGVRELCHTQR